MELITILNRCYRHRGFVYESVRFGADEKTIETRRMRSEGRVPHLRKARWRFLKRPENLRDEQYFGSEIFYALP